MLSYSYLRSQEHTFAPVIVNTLLELINARAAPECRYWYIFAVKCKYDRNQNASCLDRRHYNLLVLLCQIQMIASSDFQSIGLKLL